MGNRVTRVKPYLTLKEIGRRIADLTDREFPPYSHRWHKWAIIWHAMQYPCPAKDIAKFLRCSESKVHKWVTLFNKHGPQALEEKKRMRRRCYFTKQHEADFLAPFLHDKQGCIIDRVKQALEDHLGHSVHVSTTYRMLKRNGWRRESRGGRDS